MSKDKIKLAPDNDYELVVFHKTGDRHFIGWVHEHMFGPEHPKRFKDSCGNVVRVRNVWMLMVLLQVVKNEEGLSVQSHEAVIPIDLHYGPVPEMMLESKDYYVPSGSDKDSLLTLMQQGALMAKVRETEHRAARSGITLPGRKQ